LRAGVLGVGFALLMVSPPARASNAASLTLAQGQVLLLTVSAADADGPLVAELQGRNFRLFRLEPGRFIGLVGADMGLAPSRYEIVVRAADGGERERVELEVISAAFGRQELTLPKDKVTLDAKTLERVEREQQLLLGAMAPITDAPLWRGGFIVPVEGEVKRTFGLNRVINGEERSPHSGEDISAPSGAPVVAANSGTVALAGDYFFSGKSIILDHGLGVFTMYFHLDEIKVGQGERVEKGVAIGTVGATGRATGPHLHWGARINGARVNPFSLIDVQLP
jgi:murein DD-endopeptidase MepM/ murein hydrolase activator NlpD